MRIESGGGGGLNSFIATPTDPAYFLSDFDSLPKDSVKDITIVKNPPPPLLTKTVTTCKSLRTIANIRSRVTLQPKHPHNPADKEQPFHPYEPLPRVAYFLSVFFIFCLGIVALLNEVLGIRVRKEKRREGYIPLYNWFDTFYQNHLIRRVWSAMFSPINSAPGPVMSVIERKSENQGWDIEFTSNSKSCINLGSYNYLNLASTDSPCLPGTFEALKKYGVGLATNRCDAGTTEIHKKLEKALANFIGVEDSVTFGMGFATNSLNIPSLMDSETLVLSDQFNHASIILGIRMSRAKIVVFAHNDMIDLETKIRQELIKASVNGNRWKKMFIVVEGVYSMHGSMAKLREIIRIKEKYGAYLYLDEAHCMGAVGTNGRGISHYYNVDPNKVDILMGTFAKSFGAIGGYIAGSKNLVDLLRKRSNAHYYGTSMPPVVAAFILEGIKFLSDTSEGAERVSNLARNTRYFRQRMQQMGYIISGDDDSPVVPVTVTVGTLRFVVDFMRERNIAAVMVGYPASPLTEGRIRCCMNALHTKDMIDYVLQCFEELSQQFDLRMSSLPRTKNIIEY